MSPSTASGPQHRLHLAATVEIARMEAEARHARERLQLYRAKTYGPRATDPAHLRDLERRSRIADASLSRARNRSQGEEAGINATAEPRQERGASEPG